MNFEEKKMIRIIPNNFDYQNANSELIIQLQLYYDFLNYIVLKFKTEKKDRN